MAAAFATLTSACAEGDYLGKPNGYPEGEIGEDARAGSGGSAASADAKPPEWINEPMPDVDAGGASHTGDASAPEAADPADAGSVSDAGRAPDAPNADGSNPPDGAVEESDVDSCPGEVLTAGASAKKNHTTQSLGNEYQSSPACSSVTTGREAVYRFVAPTSGRVTATLTPHGYAGLLYVRADACESGAQIACTNGGILNVSATASFDVTAGSSYFVFADQALGLTDGWFELAIAY